MTAHVTHLKLLMENLEGTEHVPGAVSQDADESQQLMGRSSI